jgi:hypothetical protein
MATRLGFGGDPDLAGGAFDAFSQVDLLHDLVTGWIGQHGLRALNGPSLIRSA